MTRPIRLIALLGVLVLALAAASPAMAATPRASFNDLEDEVMCDVCGIPLNIAESPRAEQQRQELKQLIAQGLTKKQIKATLVARYGPSILATPIAITIDNVAQPINDGYTPKNQVCTGAYAAMCSKHGVS